MFSRAELLEAGRQARHLRDWAADLLATTNERAKVVPLDPELREALYADIRRDRAHYIQAIRDHDAICEGMKSHPEFLEGYGEENAA